MMGTAMRFDECIHADACLDTAKRLTPIYGRPNDMLRCDDCERFEKDPCSICPMRLSGMMRCEGQR